MKTILIQYKQLWLIFLLWIAAGIISQPLAIVVVLISAILFLLKGRSVELFIGYLFILLLSDFRVLEGLNPMQFAKTFKVIYFLLLVLFIWRNRADISFGNPIFKAFLPFFIISFVGLFWAINLPIGVQKTVSYTLMYMVIPVLFVFIYNKKGKNFIEAIAAYFFLILLGGLIIQIVNPSITQIVGERFRGLFGNPNGLGLFLVQLVMILTIFRHYKLLTLKRRDWNIFYLLIVISLVLSGSRNGMISIILFLVLIRVFKIHFLAGILMLFGAFYIYQLIDANPVVLIQSLGLEEFFRLDTIESGSGRFIAWEFAWQKIQDSFFIGGGFGQDEQIMRPNYEMLMMLGHHGGVHNSYLSFWMDTGLIGVMLFFGAFITLIWKASKHSFLAWPFFFTILFNITYESWLVGSLNPFTIVFICSLTLLVMKDKFRPESDVKYEMRDEK